MLSICVFCGSREGNRPEYSAAAEELGSWISENQCRLIYGGGSTGIMGRIADAVLDGNGQIVGVITEQLAQPELMHHGVSDMRIVADMHRRKAMMHELSDVYVTLPGALGTMEEFFEAAAWAQLTIHARPVAILSSGGFYAALTELLDAMVQADFLSLSCRRLIHVFSETSALCEWLAEQQRVLNQSA